MSDEKTEKRRENVLVLCVDRDNDIGAKGEVKTPVIGRNQNIKAASKLALRDPEEADANAIFGAVRTYDTLSAEAEDEEYEVATIAGSELGGVKADKKLRDQLVEVLGAFPAESVILVTDGFADEAVIPIIQSRVPIMSVERVVVRHSAAIEESWALASRYLRKLVGDFRRLVGDPFYARLLLGIPGILIITFAILSFFNLLLYAGLVISVILGSYLLVKGFGIDERLSSMSMPILPGQVRLFTTLAALIIVGVDLYRTYIAVASHLPGDPSLWWASFPMIAGLVMAYATDLIVIAICVLLVGRGIYYFFIRDSRIWQNVLGVIVCTYVGEVTLRASRILLEPTPPTSVADKLVVELLLSVVVGMAVTVVAILVTFKLSKRFSYYFKKTEA